MPSSGDDVGSDSSEINPYLWSGTPRRPTHQASTAANEPVFKLAKSILVPQLLAGEGTFPFTLWPENMSANLNTYLQQLWVQCAHKCGGKKRWPKNVDTQPPRYEARMVSAYS